MQRSAPEYLLQTPERASIPFPETLNVYRNAAIGWVDLQSGMQLRVDEAFYRDGAAQRNIASYLGTDIARFAVRSNGRLRLTSVQVNSKAPRTRRQRVQDTVPSKQLRYARSRFFYAVALNRRGQARGAVLLGGSNASEVDRLTKQLLADPEGVCGPRLPHCTVIPENATATVEMTILVNGAPKIVAWGDSLDRVVKNAPFSMQRLDHGRLTPVEIDIADRAALKLPLMPGDRIDLR